MPARANFQKNYLTRYLIVAGICLFLAAWFGYDGLVGYPQTLVHAQAWEKLAEYDELERKEKWQKVAKENGYPLEPPRKKAADIETDIYGQYFWALVNLAVGLPALYFYFSARGSWVEETSNGLKTSWGQEVDFSTVTALDLRSWKDKGIARAKYSENGIEKRFVFDDFKYDREPLGEMLTRLKRLLSPDQIVGGEPESETDS